MRSAGKSKTEELLFLFSTPDSFSESKQNIAILLVADKRNHIDDVVFSF